jgi:16S rRNA (cytosine1402-N4)-methyltransferase
MRMDQTQDLTAEKVVNTYSQKELIQILRDYGEEYRAPKIVRAIVANRPITTTNQLAEVVKSAAKQGYSKTHPATKTFQAIRIAVNQELEMLKRALPLWEKLLSPDGRLVVISFHSLEDRIVKQYFAERTDGFADSEGHEVSLRKLTKKPITATEEELVLNPRARSAKLRAVAKIKTERST